MSTPRPDASALSARDAALASGLVLLVLSVYLLTGPGRIDTVDGQLRAEVAYDLLVHGTPVLLDPRTPELYTVPGARGPVSVYGPAASVVSSYRCA